MASEEAESEKNAALILIRIPVALLQGVACINSQLLFLCAHLVRLGALLLRIAFCPLSWDHESLRDRYPDRCRRGTRRLLCYNASRSCPRRAYRLFQSNPARCADSQESSLDRDRQAGLLSINDRSLFPFFAPIFRTAPNRSSAYLIGLIQGVLDLSHSAAKAV